MITLPSRRCDRNWGFGVLLVAFLGALLISWRSVRAVRQPSVPAPPSSEGIVGFPATVDPLASLVRARKLTRRRQLRSWMAIGVRSDGTLDLTRRTSGARFEFDSMPGSGPAPDPAPDSPAAGPYCGRQTIQLTKKGLYADPDRPRAVCLAHRAPSLPAPRCTLKTIWGQGLKHGARATDRAVIEYYRAKSSPAWKFTIPGTSVRFVLAPDCRSELTGTAALRF